MASRLHVRHDGELRVSSEGNPATMAPAKKALQESSLLSPPTPRTIPPSLFMRLGGPPA